MSISWLSEARWINRERLKVYPRIFVVVYLAIAIGWISMGDGALDRRGEPIGSDFVSFYASSALALDGEPAKAYDFASHSAAEKVAVGGRAIAYYSWHYPPVFLLMVLPLALLPYQGSLLIWLLATYLAYLFAIRQIAPNRDVLWLAAVFPAVFINLGHGQNGFLAAALMGGALLLLDRRPISAGILIGLLAFKPHLGILIPLALLVGGRWRALLSATATTFLVAGASYVAFGYDTWVGFVENIPVAGDIMAQGMVSWHKLQSVFAATRLLGGGVALAYALQGLVAIIAGIAVVWTWTKPIGMPLKGAALVTGTLLATPFLLDYDLMLLALPLALIGYEGYVKGFLPWERIILAVVWIHPLWARSVNEAIPVPFTPALLLMLMWLIVRRVVHELAREALPDQSLHAAQPSSESPIPASP